MVLKAKHTHTHSTPGFAHFGLSLSAFGQAGLSLGCIHFNTFSNSAVSIGLLTAFCCFVKLAQGAFHVHQHLHHQWIFDYQPATSLCLLPSKCSLEFCFGWKFAIICMQLHLKVNKWTNRVRRKATLAWEKAIEVNNQRSLTLIQKPTGATTGNVGGALHGLWCIPYSGKRSIHDLLKSDMQSCLFVAFLKSIAGMLTTCFTFQTSVSRRALALWWLSCTSEVHHFLQRMCLR